METNLSRGCLRINKLRLTLYRLMTGTSRISEGKEGKTKWTLGIYILYNRPTRKWGKAQDWRLLADVGRQLQVPQCIVVTMRPMRV